MCEHAIEDRLKTSDRKQNKEHENINTNPPPHPKKHGYRRLQGGKGKKVTSLESQDLKQANKNLCSSSLVEPSRRFASSSTHNLASLSFVFTLPTSESM
mmetsp:Transcript_28237/g.72033  ORF Transcript_28237/g.72033 Transcript_28237/m.72033 type:complete len:99 (-) Transcript_28237:880-1176(-)